QRSEPGDRREHSGRPPTDLVVEERHPAPHIGGRVRLRSGDTHVPRNSGARRMPGLVSQGTAFSLLNTGAVFIGGPLASDGNVVAGFGHSINLGSGTCTIQGNFIGVD